MAKKKEIKEEAELVEIKKIEKTPRERRMELAGVTKKQVEEDSKEEFRKYFIQLSRKIRLKKDMESVLWNHLKSSGNDSKAKFEDGIKNFGYKI